MKTILTLLLSFALCQAGAQGRVVINEYMPWPNSNCGTTSEFVELLNFGPGPVNIGCYIITEGDYAITIPANTILQPGQFYVIAGQSTIAAGCANIDSATTVHLNWNNCNNCVSAPIPTSNTSDGLFTDGGSASEQVVLLDPSLKVVDAVVRDISLKETSATITTAASAGCTARSFNLDDMGIHYEMIGSSAGRGNSFARTVDGDCQWVKDTRQSGSASNTVSSDTSSIKYTLTITSAKECNSAKGAIAITPSSNTAFPLNYTLAFDADKNGTFGTSDTYTNGVDSTAPHLEVTDLAEGFYRISVGSAMGCNLKIFEFNILPCSALLALQLLEFRHAGTTATQQIFSFRLADGHLLKEAVLEQSVDGTTFSAAGSINPENYIEAQGRYTIAVPKSGNRYFRLRLRSTEGSVVFSPHLSLGTAVVMENKGAWPNPATSLLYFSIPFSPETRTYYQVHNLYGAVVQKGLVKSGAVLGGASIPVHQLPGGLYQVALYNSASTQPITLRFVKR